MTAMKSLFLALALLFATSFTAQAVVGIKTIPNNYTSDWSNGLPGEWAEISHGTVILPQGVLVGEEYVLRYSSPPESQIISPRPRFVISTKDDFEVVIPTTLNTAVAAGKAYYHAAALYNGETHYAGLYCKGDGSVYSINAGIGEVGAPNLPEVTVKAPGWWAKGDKLTHKIVNDVAAGQTRFYLKKNDGEYELLLTRNTADPLYPWMEAATLWITGYQIRTTQVGTPFNIDIHPVTITRPSTTQILAGAAGTYPWSKISNQSTSGYNSWDITAGDDGTYTGVILLGEYEGGAEPAGMIPPVTEDLDTFDLSMMGNQTSLSPVISGEMGSLRLYGRARNGVCRVRILDTALNPISVGGVTEFFPDSGAWVPLEVDLSEISQTEIRLEMYLETLDNDYIIHYGGGNYLVEPTIPAILYCFVVESRLTTATRDGSIITLRPLEGSTAYYRFDGDPEVPPTEIYAEPITIPDGAQILYFYGTNEPIQSLTLSMLSTRNGTTVALKTRGNATINLRPRGQ